MNFPLSIYLLSIVAGSLTTLLTLPLWRWACRRLGQVDHPGPRKIHQDPTPLAGGFAIATGLLLPLLLAWFSLCLPLHNPATAEKLIYGFSQRAAQLGAFGFGAIAMLLLGAWDDRHPLKAGPKFAVQLLIALLVAGVGIRITLFIPSLLFSYAITVLWILGVTNAFNFMDNMNGLCTGLGLVAALLIGTSAARHGQYLVAALSFLASGTLLGFLPHNFPRATSFLGDAGSHLIGYLLATLSILPHFYTSEHPTRLAVFSPVLILALPLFDLASVVFIRWRKNRPFYIGDTNHLSHRLVRRGFSPAQAVWLLWLAGAVVGSIALFLN